MALHCRVRRQHGHLCAERQTPAMAKLSAGRARGQGALGIVATQLQSL